MTSTAADICPLCNSPYAAMSSHLRRTHSIENPQERRLLLNLAHGRVNIRNSPCPVEACSYTQGRLDKHLGTCHPELSETVRTSVLQKVRRDVTMGLIREIRQAYTGAPGPSSIRVEEAGPGQDVDAGPGEDGDPGPGEGGAAGPGEDGDPGLLDERAEQETVLFQPWEPPEALPGAVVPLPGEVTSFLRDFKRYFNGGNPDAKLKENTKSKANRVRGFLHYMARDRLDLDTWLFLDNVKRIQKWPSGLTEARKCITTVSVYLKNVLQFMDYFMETPPPTCRLTRKQQRTVRRALSRCLRGISRDIVTHQIQVKEAKVLRAPSPKDLAACREMARTKIPEILGKRSTTQIHLAHFDFVFEPVCSLPTTQTCWRNWMGTSSPSDFGSMGIWPSTSLQFTGIARACWPT